MRIIRYNQPATRGYARANYGSNRSPWAGFESEIDRLFTSAVGNVAGHTPTQFPVDLYEDKNNAFVRAELPGINRDDINVELVDGSLNINATRKTKTGDDEKVSRFSRSISVPDTVQSDKVQAAYENGVLTVTLPKREESKPRKINVAVS